MRLKLDFYTIVCALLTKDLCIKFFRQTNNGNVQCIFSQWPQNLKYKLNQIDCALKKFPKMIKNKIMLM